MQSETQSKTTMLTQRRTSVSMGQASRGVITKQMTIKNIMTTLGGFRQLNIVLSREEAFEHHDWYVFGNIFLKHFIYMD